MLMNKPVGGRGKKAPYQTKTIRIPVELESDVEQLIQQYRLQVIDGTEPRQKKIASLSEAKMLVKKLLKAKKSKLDTVHKLVTGIYKVDIDKQELTD